MMTPKQIHTSNGKVAYWVNGRRKQEYALVFLHGLTADHTLFERQIPYFEGRYRVLCWDAPAHGKSRPYANFSYHAAAEHLKDILEKEQIGKAVLIGQSMGGYIIQAFLKRYAEFGIGFIGIDTTPFGRSYYSASDKWWLRQIERMAHCYPRKALVKAIARSCTSTQYAYENMLAALSQYTKRELCRLMGIGYADFLKENCDLALECPVLLLVGEKDRTGKVKRYCKAWQEETGYPLHVVPNAAHHSNLDNYERVNAEIEAFLAALGGKGTGLPAGPSATRSARAARPVQGADAAAD